MTCPISRRGFFKGTLGVSVLAAMRGREVLAQTSGNDVLWVQLVAEGGWDQVLFTDPKQGLRTYGTATPQLAGSIPYVSFPEVAPFFQANASRMLVFNGVDTSTNNHDVGHRHSMSGSLLEGFPIFAAQVAGSLGADRLLPMFTLWDYSEAGGLIASNRIDYRSGPLIAELKEMNKGPRVYKSPIGDVSTDAPLLPTVGLADLNAARAARLQRLQVANKLPGHQRGLDWLKRSQAAAARMPELDLSPLSPALPDTRIGNAKTLVARGIDAFSKGLVTTIVAGVRGFDTHGGQADSVQLEALGELFDLAGYVISAADQRNVPVVMVMSSDFGRTAIREGTTGTGHWPISTMLVVQNSLAAAKGLLPVNRLVGGTTGEVASPNPTLSTVLRARKINPDTLAFSDTGVVPTPAHVFRILRRAAKIDTSSVMRDFPLSITGKDLTV